MSSIDGKRTAGDRLGTAPLKGLIVSMALPTVAAQLVNLLYNLVDRVYADFAALAPLYQAMRGCVEEAMNQLDEQGGKV